MLRMLKLLPEQVSRKWATIKWSVEQALPPTAYAGTDRMNKVLSALLAGKLECFVLYKEEQASEILGVLVTQFMSIVDSEQPVLFIYTLFGTGVASGKDWVRLLGMVKDYARANNCSHIHALSKESSVIKIIKIMGGETEYHLLSLEV